MSDRKLKIVIVDDNRERSSTIKSLLPDYAEGFVCNYGNSAMSAIRPDGDGRNPDLVIINADDKNGQGLSTFDWMINKEPVLENIYIPVILLTEDEFSDRILDFLEIADAFIYEGDIIEETFYSIFIEAIESDAPLPIELPSYIEEKSADRIIGKSISAPSGTPDKPMRSVVISNEDRMGNLEAALARGLRRTNEIKAILLEAQESKEEKRTNSEGIQSAANRSSLDSKPEKINLEVSAAGRAFMNQGFVKHNSSADDFYKHFENMSAPKTEEKPVVSPYARKKQTVVVIEEDSSIYRLVKLYLKDQYNVIGLDSNMKAIDFFVRNKADIIMIGAMISNLPGVQTLKSIRWQPNGSNVPAIFIIGDDYKGNPAELMVENVYSTLKKPFSKAKVLTALAMIEQLKGRK